MKLISLLSISMFLLICSFTFPKHRLMGKKIFLSTPKNGFAVVELFTSEGCSSCPPADEVIAKIQKEDYNQPVYILSYHVDYWNNSGWKDVFSSAEYSKRQSDYANWLNLGSVYTPQIVVNGHKEFVGSQESILRNEIKNKLNEAEVALVQLKDLKKNKLAVNFNYHTERVSQNIDLQVALVQKSGQTYVKRGENGGRTLSHIQIVRKFKSYNVFGKSTGNINLDIPSELKNQKLEIIAFLQNKRNGQIVAATKNEF